MSPPQDIGDQALLGSAQPSGGPNVWSLIEDYEYGISQQDL